MMLQLSGYSPACSGWTFFAFGLLFTYSKIITKLSRFGRAICLWEPQVCGFFQKLIDTTGVVEEQSPVHTRWITWLHSPNRKKILWLRGILGGPNPRISSSPVQFQGYPGPVGSCNCSFDSKSSRSSPVPIQFQWAPGWLLQRSPDSSTYTPN